MIGAGGTSRAALFALQSIRGVSEIIIWNRTYEKAQALAKEFSAVVVHDLKSALITGSDCNIVIIGTIPASGQENLDFSMFSAPSSYTNAIVIELAYRPRETPLIIAAKNCSKPFVVVEGIQVLLEQGFEQFRLWTGKEPPRKAITKAVLANY